MLQPILYYKDSNSRGSVTHIRISQTFSMRILEPLGAHEEGDRWCGVRVPRMCLEALSRASVLLVWNVSISHLKLTATKKHDHLHLKQKKERREGGSEGGREDGWQTDLDLDLDCGRQGPATEVWSSPTQFTHSQKAEKHSLSFLPFLGWNRSSGWCYQHSEWLFLSQIS